MESFVKLIRHKSGHALIRSYRRRKPRVRNRISTSYDQHKAVPRAIIDGDGEPTAERFLEHILIQEQRFADLISSLTQLTAQAA